ncbi:hypothetical protein RhiirA4_484824 [Rhizophagus irregularis]|uniref:RNase H type-1 domain-containing protein n=1 Tax=Rhizophagus irregularis TaxID=588596 RepID=A0A2I1HPD7_9GLOM|nr:hypothetical protein RhiirA4_484824 [Rhizophagus irregularis]
MSASESSSSSSSSSSMSNENLKIISPSSLHLKLIDISHQLFSFNSLNFYTDGSLFRQDDMTKMGFGWIFSSDTSLDIKHNDSCTHWTSSTTAEIYAIMACLITCLPDSTINIYTNSNCAIHNSTIYTHPN